MHTTIKTPGRLLIGLALTLALLLTPLFAHTANASTVDYGSASYGSLPEMDDSGATDDLFGKRKKRKAAEAMDALKVQCQQLRSFIEQARANRDPNCKCFDFDHAEAEDLYRELNCDTVLAS